MEGRDEKMYNKIELIHEELLNESKELKEQIRHSEMTEFQRDFLCGMLKYKHPHKIVEIGVSAGATTAVILNYLKTINIQCEMYSVDLNETWYRNNAYETGFVVKKYMKIASNIQHKFILGKPIPYVIEEIGNDIDFLILDTVHSLPGEVLDFLICMPYLNDHAVVILHDIVLNHIGELHQMACNSLFSTVRAEKWYMEEQDLHLYGMSNIAAFEVSNKTKENIKDIFMSLSMKWNYLIPEDWLQEYNRILEKNYDKEIITWMKKIEDMQMLSYMNEQVNKHTKIGEELLQAIWKNEKNVILYGTGYWGKIYLNYAKSHHLPVTCFVISDGQEKVYDSIDEIPVCFFHELAIEPNGGIIIRALDESKWYEITKNLIQAGWYKII